MYKSVLPKRYLCLLAVFAAHAGAAPRQDFDFNLSAHSPSSQATANTVRGPVTVHITGINPIRYTSVQINSTTTMTNGPDISGLSFIPSLAAPKAAAPAAAPSAAEEAAAKDPAALRAFILGPAAVATTTATDLFNGSVRQESVVRTGLINQIAGINQQIDALNQRVSSIQALAVQVDDLLRGAQLSADVIKSGIQNPSAILEKDLIAVSAKGWPFLEIATLAGTITDLQTSVLAIPVKATDWVTWSGDATHKQAYLDLASRVSELVTTVTDLGKSDNASLVKFQSLHTQFTSWSTVLDQVSMNAPSPDSKFDHFESCSFAFGGTKSTAVQLSARDRFAASDVKPITWSVVAVECTSPLSIRAGIGISSLSEGTVASVTSNKTDSAGKAQSVFGYQARSSFHPMPVILLNTRLWEPNDTFSFHLSGGAVVNTNAPTGTDLEYIAGGSLAISRSAFFTAGVHIGRTITLSKESGFNIGDVVPAGLGTLPLEKQWEKAFVFAMTWKIK